MLLRSVGSSIQVAASQEQLAQWLLTARAAACWVRLLCQLFSRTGTMLSQQQQGKQVNPTHPRAVQGLG
jgi:hypothetical protein